MKRNKNSNSLGLRNKDFKSKTYPQGSYTGTCKDPCEKPVQDADDL